MNSFFEDNLIERISELVEYTDGGDQKMVKEMMVDDYDNFPMICFEYTPDSDFEVTPDESKFLNDSVHNGLWVVGYDDEQIRFAFCLESYGDTLEIDTLEVNKDLRGEGIGGNIIFVIESVAEDYFKSIRVSPFDTSAINFWEHMDYVEGNRGYWVKVL